MARYHHFPFVVVGLPFDFTVLSEHTTKALADAAARRWQKRLAQTCEAMSREDFHEACRALNAKR